ncbi:MAG: 50S ribosomal protein L35 [Actinomycetota bacterium]|nr:50S ribosomal protein L35 [Actinomycetota bacterium]
MKQKTHSGAKKRFRVTRTGKVLSKQRNRSHLLEKKSSRRKRRLAGLDELGKPASRRAKKLLNL